MCRGRRAMTIDLQSLSAAVELVAAAKKYLTQNKRERDYSVGDAISAALRVLYFTPNGIIKFLRKVETGGTISANDIREALTNFNDREWQVTSALSSLDFDKLVKELRLNLATTSALELVRAGKSDLRREIQQEINYYGQPGIVPDKKKLRGLIDSILLLNQSIEEVEALVNTRALGH